MRKTLIDGKEMKYMEQLEKLPSNVVNEISKLEDVFYDDNQPITRTIDGHLIEIFEEV